MTEQQIIEKLATKVMGWEIRRIDYKSDGSFYEAYFENDLFLNYCDSFVWNPIKYIEDAWMVVEKLYIAVIPLSPRAPEDMRFMAYIDIDPATKIEAFAKSAQEAICNAAIKAIESSL